MTTVTLTTGTSWTVPADFDPAASIDLSGVSSKFSEISHPIALTSSFGIIPALQGPTWASSAGSQTGGWTSTPTPDQSSGWKKTPLT